MELLHQWRCRRHELDYFDLIDQRLRIGVIEIEKSGFSVIVKGPIFLPRRKKIFTVNRSHHVNKKSRDQFLLQDHGRMWIISINLPFLLKSDFLDRNLLHHLRFQCIFGLPITLDWKEEIHFTPLSIAQR